MKLAPDMETADRSHFDFMRSDEVTLMFFRKHGISLLFALGRRWVPAMLIFIVLLWVQLTLITFENFYIPALALHFFNIGYSLWLAHWFFMILINYFLNFIVITNRNIIEVHKTVFLREAMNQIAFEDIQSIQHQKTGMLSNLLQYGMLQVESNVASDIRMHYVPRSEQKATKISEILGDYIKAPENKRDAE